MHSDVTNHTVTHCDIHTTICHAIIRSHMFASSAPLSRGCGEVFCDPCSSYYVAQQRMCQYCQRSSLLLPATEEDEQAASSTRAQEVRLGDIIC